MQVAVEGVVGCAVRHLPSYLLVGLNVGNVVAQWLGVV